MAGALRVEHDVEVARWVQEGLSDFGSVAASIPPIFQAYARILHPATRAVPTGATDAWGNPQLATHEITWVEAAELIGDRVGETAPSTAWLARFGAQQLVMPDGGRIDEPHSGDITLPLLTDLARLLVDEHGDADVLVAVWEGSGLDASGSAYAFLWSDDEESTPAERSVREAQARADARAAQIAAVDPEIRAAMTEGRVLGLPREDQGRGHVLLRGRLAALTDPGWVEGAGLGWRGDFGRTPNLLWPASPHAAPDWMVATDLDLDVTVVGGSGHLIGRALAHPSFEAERVLPTDPLI